MRICLFGNGERERYLKRLAVRRGHQIVDTGFDAAVMELPISKLDRSMIDRLKEGDRIICGQYDGDFLLASKEMGLKLYKVLEDERYLKENAVLSAEGAVYAAMREADFSLCGSLCLVVGYGRIGSALTGMLRGIGACVHVAARRKESRDEAGEGSMEIRDIQERIGDYRVIFNTVPQRVIGKEALKNARKDCLLIELASAPYGIDREAAERLQLRYIPESGIPGRYCPESAAKILLQYIERSVQENE